MSKSTDRSWIDVQATDFSDKVQALLRQERKMYDELKAHKALILSAIKAEVDLQTKTIVGVGYTRWGQLQLTVADSIVDAPKPNARPTLAQFMAMQRATGHRA